MTLEFYDRGRNGEDDHRHRPSNGRNGDSGDLDRETPEESDNIIDDEYLTGEVIGGEEEPDLVTFTFGFRNADGSVHEEEQPFSPGDYELICILEVLPAGMGALQPEDCVLGRKIQFNFSYRLAGEHFTAASTEPMEIVFTLDKDPVEVTFPIHIPEVVSQKVGGNLVNKKPSVMKWEITGRVLADNENTGPVLQHAEGCFCHLLRSHSIATRESRSNGNGRKR